MEKQPYEYSQYEQFGPSISRPPQKKQYHEVIGFPVNADQSQPYVPANLQQASAPVSQKTVQQQGYAPAQQRIMQTGMIQQQGYAPTKQPLPQSATAQKPKPPKPMPKASALALVNTLKKSLVVASLATFVSFGGLAAFHQVGTTAAKTASTSSTSTSTTSTQSNGKNFLKQSGGNTSGTGSSTSGTSSSSSSSSGTGSSSSSSSGTTSGTGSSNSSSSSSSPAVTGSSVS